MPDHGAQGVLITGLYGSGKSAVAAEITYLLEQRDQPYALLDLDYFVRDVDARRSVQEALGVPLRVVRLSVPWRGSSVRRDRPLGSD